MLIVRELGIGGCERDLTKLAIALDRQHFEPHVASFRGYGIRADDLSAAGVPVVEFPVRSFLSASVMRHARTMRSYLAANHIQLVHAFDTPTDIFAVPVARWAGVPVLSSQLWQSDVIPGLYRFLVRQTHRLADAVVVNSDAVRRHLIEREGVPASRVFLNHNGVETGVFHPGGRQKPDILAGASVVAGTVCALRPEKRVDLLIRAFARVCDAHPDALLLIVGSGPTEPELLQLASQLQIGNRLRMVPRQQDVAGWMRAIDLFVLSSDSESFPNALLEAMACGCSVIGSRVGGVPELIADGVSGLLFDPGSEDQLAAHLETLLSQHGLRKQLAAEAARRAREEFSMGAVVNRMEALYQRVLTTGSI